MRAWKNAFGASVGILLAGMLLAVGPAQGGSGARNVIFMVPDGMGLAHLTLARRHLGGVDGPPLALESLAKVGLQRTYSEGGAVTDSAAAASAWACGEKFANGRISCHDRNEDGHCDIPLPLTLMEIARVRGKSLGLVATSTVTHATPAAFAAHVPSRKCEAEIARQYLEETEVEVVLGGGFGDNEAPCPFPPMGSAGRARLLEEAERLGYAVVTDRSDLRRSIQEGTPRILGLFARGPLIPAHRRPPNCREPSLAEMTRAALTVLEKDPDGFFLVVEGSQIDWGAHRHDIPYVVGEISAFDKAVQEVQRWMDEDPHRARETLLIVAPDHETGGLTLLGPRETQWATRRHTGVDVPLWSQGPGSKALQGTLDNVEVFRVVRDSLHARAGAEDPRTVGPFPLPVRSAPKPIHPTE
jgi:alkaline phosphatase